MRVSLSLLTLGLAACGGSVALVASPDASAPDAADASGGGDAGEGVAHCPWEKGGPDGSTIAYDKHCATVADCAIGTHLNNCCGQLIALGVNAGDLSRFSRDGGLCGDEFPMCKCLAGGTVAEDGRISTKPHGADIVVGCVSGTCVTHVAP